MNKTILRSVFLLILFLPMELAFSEVILAQTSSLKRRRRVKAYVELDKALDFIKKGDFTEGTKRLFMVRQNRQLRNRRTEISFILGKTFLQMGLYHSASFQLISVINTGTSRYIRRSLELLSEIAAKLGDDSLLKLAMRKQRAKQLRGAHRYLLFYQYGKYALRRGDRRKAIFYFKKIPITSPLYYKARYNLGLTWAEMKKNNQALAAFNDITSGTLPPSDPVHSAAVIGKARVYYQAKKWDQATRYYRQVPKDSSFWHDTLFENSWALLRAGRFRSALNGFQTLHSSYYRDYFQPGSLLLRSIIYMYICKYEEMEKVLNLFQATYFPMRSRVKDLLKSKRNYYPLVKQALEGQGGHAFLHPVMAGKISRENDFQSMNQYIKELEKERAAIDKLPLSWRMSSAGRYGLKLVQNNQKKSRKAIDKIIRRHLRSAVSQLDGFFNQKEYLRYEMLRGKREMLRKKIAVKGLAKTPITRDVSRDFFVQNGFEFWPFEGEYWLDELGSYYYVGAQNCR